MHHIVVIGGTNEDIVARAAQPIVTEDSNQGTIRTSFGGVGRNIAELLARTGMRVDFFSVIGRDTPGRNIKAFMEDLGVRGNYCFASHTPRYMALLDSDGDMRYGINDMEALSALNPAFLKTHASIVGEADAIVLDANVDVSVMDYVFSTFDTIMVEAVSAQKVKKLIPYLHSVHTLKCNKMELQALSGRTLQSETDIDAALQVLLEKGVGRVALTLGSEGARLATKTMNQSAKAPAVTIVSTNGAGDAFFAGLIYGDARGGEALPYAQAYASLALQSDGLIGGRVDASLLQQIAGGLKVQKTPRP